VEEFGAKRVYLFGSLAEDLFRGTSDIDLVVEGLATDVYFKALSRISCLSREFQIDLIPLEEYKYKQELCEKGILLYESRRSKSAAAPAGGSAEGIR
jgi:predicted nucleotidyltransferase